jgi:flagellar basal body-associated protein FliL
MDKAAENQTPARKKKNTLNRVLLLLIIVLSVFIVACLCLSVFLIVRQGPVEPRPMVLLHPSDAMVSPGRILSRRWRCPRTGRRRISKAL